MTIPQIDIEKPERSVPDPTVVWQNKVSGNYYRLVVVHFPSGNPSQAVLEKCNSYDSMNMPIWTKLALGDVPQILLNDLAKLSSENDKILENNDKTRR